MHGHEYPYAQLFISKPTNQHQKCIQLSVEKNKYGVSYLISTHEYQKEEKIRKTRQLTTITITYCWYFRYFCIQARNKRAHHIFFQLMIDYGLFRSVRLI